MDGKKCVYDFLVKYGMHYDSIDMEQCCNEFINEMDRGLSGKASSLRMLSTYVSPDGSIMPERPVIVMDAGGTNFRVAVVCFDIKKNPIITDFKTYPMPGSRREIGKEEFFGMIAKFLDPVINKSNRIGFCFSYPTEILPDKDGRLIRFDKEVRVRDMEGIIIGANLLKTLKEKGIKGEKKIVITNDTVATLLGGKAAYPDRRFDSYVGFILGTGTNTCYAEENRNIAKTPALAARAGTTLINIESGGYGNAPAGEIDKIFDSGTNDPGSQRFEKMISGAYQGGLLLLTLKLAGENGVFSEDFVSSLKDVDQLTAKEIDDFCYYPYATDNVLARCSGSERANNGEEDRLRLYYIIDAIIERAAKLAAVNIASVIIKTGKGKNPCLPVCVSAEGTTFYRSKLFRNKLDYYIKEYMNDRKGLYCEFVKADNTTLVGTAIAGLSD